MNQLAGKNVLFVGGPAEAIPGFGQAKALGVGVYVTDGNPDAPGLRWAKRHGAGWGVASTYDVEQTVDVAWRLTDIDGVVALACDVGPVVARVAQAVGLPHINPEVADLSWDKQALRVRLQRAGVPTPDGWLHPVDRELWMEPSGTWVVKPIGGRGGREVRLARTGAELRQAIDKAGQVARLVVIEQFIPGPQLSAEAVVWGGEVAFVGFTDRDYRLEETWPRPVEFGGWGPSKWLYTTHYNSLMDTVSKVVEALGIEAGTVKLDLVLDERRELLPVVIECAIGRMSGGYSATHYWPLCYGVDFIGAALSVACGLDPAPFLPMTGRRLHCRGLYRQAAGATCNPERGRFFLALGRSRGEAEAKASQKEKVWREGLPQIAG